MTEPLPIGWARKTLAELDAAQRAGIPASGQPGSYASWTGRLHGVLEQLVEYVDSLRPATGQMVLSTGQMEAVRQAVANAAESRRTPGWRRDCADAPALCGFHDEEAAEADELDAIRRGLGGETS